MRKESETSKGKAQQEAIIPCNVNAKIVIKKLL